MKTYKLVVFVPHAAKESVKAAMFAAGAGTGEYANYDCCAFESEGVGQFRPLGGANPHVGEVGAVHHEPEVRVELIVSENNAQAVLRALKNAHPYEEPAFDLFERVALSHSQHETAS